MNFSAASPSEDFVLIVCASDSFVEVLRTRNPHKDTALLASGDYSNPDDWFDWFAAEIAKPDNSNFLSICGPNVRAHGDSVTGAVSRTYFIVS